MYDFPPMTLIRRSLRLIKIAVILNLCIITRLNNIKESKRYSINSDRPIVNLDEKSSLHGTGLKDSVVTISITWPTKGSISYFNYRLASVIGGRNYTRHLYRCTVHSVVYCSLFN